jgi:hypothetical protein
VGAPTQITARHDLGIPPIISSNAIRYLQSEKPFNADVVGQLEQRVKVPVLTQWFAIDFDFEC